MARIPVSGINDQALQALASGVREVISGLTPVADGRIFYLTQLFVANESLTAQADVELWDIAEATASDDDTTSRGKIIVGPGDTVQVTWGDGEMPFVINCCASTTAGTVAIGGAFASGYLA